MSRRGYYLLGGVLLVAFAGFAFSAFNQTLTPYVTYGEAKSLPRTVQVAGALQKGSTSYDVASSALLFTLIDPKSNETLKVRYRGLKPANFEDAVSIVAIGRFDPASQELDAGKLLVKCPSKYQGAEVERSYS